MRSTTYRRRWFWCLPLLWLAAFPVQAAAQVEVKPTTAEFDPSPEHGTTAVERYDLELYLAGGQTALQTWNLGKPAPQPDGKIRVNLTSVLPAWPPPAVTPGTILRDADRVGWTLGHRAQRCVEPVRVSPPVHRRSRVRRVSDQGRPRGGAYAGCGRAPGPYTDPVLVPGVTVIRALHVAELRQALAELAY